MTFEILRAAALVLEPQIAILCVAVFIVARWRGIRNMHSGLIIAAGINVSAMALNVAVFANGPALLASLVAQMVCVAWWLVSLIGEIRRPPVMVTVTLPDVKRLGNGREIIK